MCGSLSCEADALRVLSYSTILYLYDITTLLADLAAYNAAKSTCTSQKTIKPHHGKLLDLHRKILELPWENIRTSSWKTIKTSIYTKPYSHVEFISTLQGLRTSGLGSGVGVGRASAFSAPSKATSALLSLGCAWTTCLASYSNNLLYSF